MQKNDWAEILLQIENLATSSAGKEVINNLAPLASESEAKLRMGEILAAQELLNSEIRPVMTSLDLFSLWFERLKKKAPLKVLEIRDIRKFCHEAIALDLTLEGSKTVWANGLKNRLMDAEEPLSAIDQIISAGGEIRTDASENLSRHYKEKLDLEKLIRVTMDKLVKAHSMESLLQDRYVTTREGRWVIPIKSGMQHQLDGIIHDSSHSKQTVFMEPQSVVTLNNDLRAVNSRIEEEIERLLKELSHYLQTLSPQFEQTQDALREADVRLAQAQFALKTHAQVCDFSADFLRLTDLRHPLLVLASANSKNHVVSNEVNLNSSKRILILSGPNAGGKTVLLKSIGLACHMARCGLPICAGSSSQIPFMQQVHWSVGDSQSVDSALSTFAAHVQILKKATKAQGPRELVLIDEICGSTDPEEGSALARSFVEKFEKQKVYGVITSHLSALKSNWPTESAVISGSMEFDDARGRPTYKFIKGVHGQSMAIRTAEQVGVESEIIDRAFELMGPEYKKRAGEMKEVEVYKQEVLKIKSHLEIEAQKAAEQKNLYTLLVDRFKAEREAWLKRSVAKGEQKIDAIVEDFKQEQNKLKKADDFKAQMPEIIKASSSNGATIIQDADDFAKVHGPGSPIFVNSLQQDGVIQSAPNAKGEVLVVSNSMRLMVHWKLLSAPKSTNNPTLTIHRKKGGVPTILEKDRVVDLRGQRVEEALEGLEVQLDSAVNNSEDRLKIIHGHGTDALKKAVRAYLSRSVYVKKWKAGDGDSGGDGITWVEVGR